MASLMDLIAGYSLPNGLLNMNYKTRNRAGQPVQPSTDTITNAITEGLLPMLASAGIGTGARIAGQFGDAENLGRLAINKLGGNVNPNTTLPTQEGILSYLNSITPLKPYTDNTYTKIGENLLAPILDPTALITTAKASKPVAKAVGEHAWNKTEDMMRQQGLMPNIVAYHGTPHEIQGGFDISKVGTGEGAQAYGHGMYFAENPDVAGEYQKRLSGKTTYGERPSDSAYVHAVESFRDANYPLEQIPAEMKKAYKSITDKDIQLAIQASEKGNLYKVDIPDEHIATMLDWDKPFKKQPKIVQNAFMQILKNNEDLPLDFLIKGNATGGSLIQAIDKVKATELLNELGVKGIKYLDEGSRASKITKTPIAQLDAKIDILKKDIDSGLGNRETMERQLKVLQDERARTTKQTFNFVVFDPKTVKILEKNSKKLGE